MSGIAILFFSGAGFCLFLFVLVGVNQKQQLKKIPDRLVHYRRLGMGYQFFIGMPIDAKISKTWAKLEAMEGQFLLDGCPIDSTEVNSWLVAKPTGVLLDGFNIFEPLPKGVVYFIPPETDDEQLLDPIKLEKGNELIRVRNVKPSYSGDNSDSMMVILRNVSDGKVRVIKMEPYQKGDGGLLQRVDAMMEISSDFFNRSFEFSEDDWIEPGQLICTDKLPNGLFWIFSCVSEDGKEFITGCNKIEYEDFDGN